MNASSNSFHAGKSSFDNFSLKHFALFTIVVLCLYTSDSSAQSLYFPPVDSDEWQTMEPEGLSWCQERIDSLYAFLDTNNTRAFILLQDGKIVLEKYFGEHTESSLWQWASAGKTLTSFMVGIAQQENFLDINDPTSLYLGEGWTSCTTEQENNITVRNQLCMTSGLDDAVPDPYCTLSECLLYDSDAGTRWAYHNAPYTLLDEVIESATGIALNAYTTEKLKNPTGMTGAFIPVDYNNVFFSNARSMARFGLLMLNNGNWDGNQIMTDSDYFNDMINTSQDLNESYGYLWWLNGKPGFMVPGLQFVFNGPLFPNAPADTYSALGKDGQFINVIPSLNMVWVRMGEAPEDVLVPYLLNDGIWEYVNNLECSSDLADYDTQNSRVNIYPNPANDLITISSGDLISYVMILNAQGRIISSHSMNASQSEVDVSALDSGMYLICCVRKHAPPIVKYLIKN